MPFPARVLYFYTVKLVHDTTRLALKQWYLNLIEVKIEKKG